VYESNPIAEAWLSSYGWAGLALFKLAIILVVATLAAVVSLSRPRTGGHILTFACLAVASVVGYSINLSISEQVHADFITRPIASAPATVPKNGESQRAAFRPAKMGFDSSTLRANRDYSALLDQVQQEPR
jgi:hypothetical protein